ncbi:MAG: IseA DL-endopeptidase inhibitor family protein [Bacteroidaceae bacterium]|nr:IseA DL-endopeptidase inhibitor family protein [Bacteroidaceae bacterium]
MLASEQFIKDHFKEQQGKLYRPYGDESQFALALEKQVGTDTKDSDTFRLAQ